ncbi:MAG: hypothetical protein II768_07705, partial [Clostridia bacterium]|nr:hypothetical protein [Clostridia bacterium]
SKKEEVRSAVEIRCTDFSELKWMCEEDMVIFDRRITNVSILGIAKETMRIGHRPTAPSLSKGLTRTAASSALSVSQYFQADYLGEAPVIQL